jgi:DMSO/TMAO reductase YedYZ heme-binding membrane subunit
VRLFSDLAYGTYLGPLPMIAVVGFVTYALFLTTAILVSAKRWSARLRRVPVRVHRWMGIVAITLATLHLLMGLSNYV